MAANVSGEYRVFRYYEGMCSSSDFPKEIAKVLALGVKTQPVKDIDGNTIEEPFVLKDKNWDIVYPAPDSDFVYSKDDMTYSEYTKKILNQVDKINDTVILKTTTSPKKITTDNIDDLTVDSHANSASLTMYLEIYKPTYIANPEQYPLDCERKNITPRLVTKQMWEDSLKVTRTVEETIYNCSTLFTSNTLDSTTIGSVEFNEDECKNFLDKLNTATNSSFSISSTIANGDKVFREYVVSSGYLSKIRQSDLVLYELILDTLNGGEGIEPKEYIRLENVTMELTYEQVQDSSGEMRNTYNLVMEGTKKVTTYTLAHDPAESSITELTYTVTNTPMETLAPEYCLDGVYTPLSPNLYHSDGKRIIFDKKFSFETSEQGFLVVRYSYETTTDEQISKRATLLNNHYVLMRLFDVINEDGTGPMDNVYNASGEITQINSHVSPWSKLSWYQDFEEIFIDQIDTDIGINNIYDGTKLVPLETPGLNADTKLRYYINTNNDRFSLIIVGNPSLDYERDRHIISACYCGRIDSFENSINDIAGNFALFTSSSTQPCNTVLKLEKMTTPQYEEDKVLNKDKDKDENGKLKTKPDRFLNHIKDNKWYGECTGERTYYITLNNKKYFDREVWPRYIILDSDDNVIGDVSDEKNYARLKPAYKRNFIINNGKADTLQITIEPEDTVYVSSGDGKPYHICIDFGFYEEQYIITSGVSRDIFGNVTGVDKVKDYGNNTSDGTTSIMMYHTRSKAFYQKHHMLFATTEEYMSRVMYGKSSYTGEYYADRIKVTHGNDGPRGTLSDILAIDSSSLYAMDELVINKDFEKDPEQYEETFVYFPVTAPYSPFSDSPNARYGVAIKKEEVEPDYADESIILKVASEELQTIADGAWNPADTNIAPRDKTSNGCSVYWQVLKDTAWTGKESNKSDYVPLKLAVTNTSEYKGEKDTQATQVYDVVLASGGTNADKTYSYVNIEGFTANEGETIMYGISDVPYGDSSSDPHAPYFQKNAQIKVLIDDNAEDNPESFEYNLENVPYTETIGETIPSDTPVRLIDAAPGKYLMLYSVKTETDTENSKERYIISKYACVPLNGSTHINDLLRYPCTVSVVISRGAGKVWSQETDWVSCLNIMAGYGSSVEIPVKPDANTNYVFKEYEIINEDGKVTKDTLDDTKMGDTQHGGIKLENITSNTEIRIYFTSGKE